MYDYQKMKSDLFTEKGQVEFTKTRDAAIRMFKQSGAFTMGLMLSNNGIRVGDTWTMMAYVDRLVELGEIREVAQPNVTGQHRVFLNVSLPLG